MNEEVVVVNDGNVAIATKSKNKWPRISDIDFANKYKEAKSLDELANLVGMPKANCSVRANALRNKGFDLPKFKLTNVGVLNNKTPETSNVGDNNGPESTSN